MKGVAPKENPWEHSSNVGNEDTSYAIVRNPNNWTPKEGRRTEGEYWEWSQGSLPRDHDTSTSRYSLQDGNEWQIIEVGHITWRMDISIVLMHAILDEDLGMRKVSANGEFRMLCTDQKTAWVHITREFLRWPQTPQKWCVCYLEWCGFTTWILRLHQWFLAFVD